MVAGLSIGQLNLRHGYESMKPVAKRLQLILNPRHVRDTLWHGNFMFHHSFIRYLNGQSLAPVNFLSLAVGDLNLLTSYSHHSLLLDEVEHG